MLKRSVVIALICIATVMVIAAEPTTGKPATRPTTRPGPRFLPSGARIMEPGERMTTTIDPVTGKLTHIYGPATLTVPTYVERVLASGWKYGWK